MKFVNYDKGEDMESQKGINTSSGPAIDLRGDLIPELKRLNETESKFSSLMLLIITILVFFSAQIVSFKWQDLVLLTGVLFFHELGHLLTMKLLKYNDVKMFFIPFVGAAVSGKNEKDSAVKSCIVTLMGPFPGIIVGVVLYFLFSLTKNYYALKAAQLMLLLNAFNFLPIMPLDGGRYIDVLFINRRYFRLFFALLGSAVFFLLAISIRDIVLGLIGLFSVFMAFTNFKLHGISQELKSQGIYAASVGELLDKEELTRTVIETLSLKYPKLFDPKIVYKGILNHLKIIVDTIKFIPAKLLSKSALLVSYLIVVPVSIGVTFFFLAMNYTEKTRIEKIDGQERVIVERYVFGKKNSECPVNAAFYYDGKGTAFSPESGIFYYSEGYRTGEWIFYDKTGKTVVRKMTYEWGQLVSVSNLVNSEWKTTLYEELSGFRRFMEEIQRISQPYKSNYRYFEK